MSEGQARDLCMHIFEDKGSGVFPGARETEVGPICTCFRKTGFSF